MAKRQLRMAVVETPAGFWVWHLIAGRNDVLAWSKPYRTAIACRSAALGIVQNIEGMDLQDLWPEGLPDALR